MGCLLDAPLIIVLLHQQNISNEVINFRVVESLLKKENRILASTTNFIYSHPRLFHSSATPSLTLSPKSKQSSSVNVEFASILSNLLRSNSLASLSLITALISSFNADFVFSSSSIPGILITNSAISITTNNINHAYINNFFLVKTSVYASNNPKYSFISSSYKTSTTFCRFNLGSLNQMGALSNANERAKRGASFKCRIHASRMSRTEVANLLPMLQPLSQTPSVS